MNIQAEMQFSVFLLYVECLEPGRVQDCVREHVPSFLGKWCMLSDKGVFGAAERFYAELSDTYREPLVERAVSLYDGKSFRDMRT